MVDTVIPKRRSTAYSATSSVAAVSSVPSAASSVRTSSVRPLSPVTWGDTAWTTGAYWLLAYEPPWRLRMSYLTRETMLKSHPPPQSPRAMPQVLVGLTGMVGGVASWTLMVPVPSTVNVEMTPNHWKLVSGW